MTYSRHTDAMIEALVNVTCGEQASERDRHVYREALRSLVRLAKAEQMSEMKSDLQVLTKFSVDAFLH